MQPQELVPISKAHRLTQVPNEVPLPLRLFGQRLRPTRLALNLQPREQIRPDLARLERPSYDTLGRLNPFLIMSCGRRPIRMTKRLLHLEHWVKEGFLETILGKNQLSHERSGKKSTTAKGQLTPPGNWRGRNPQFELFRDVRPAAIQR